MTREHSILSVFEALASANPDAELSDALRRACEAFRADVQCPRCEGRKTVPGDGFPGSPVAVRCGACKGTGIRPGTNKRGWATLRDTAGVLDALTKPGFAQRKARDARRAKQARACVHCGEPNQLDERNCNHCGKSPKGRQA